MNELKCCPFCSSNNIKVGSVGNSLGIDNYIKCVDCGAKIQICEEYGMEHLEKLWNRRTPMANIVEKLEALKNGASGCNGVMCENCEYNDICFDGEQNFKVALDNAINTVKQESENGLE